MSKCTMSRGAAEESFAALRLIHPPNYNPRPGRPWLHSVAANAADISHILSNRQLYRSGELIDAKSIHWRDCRGRSDIVDRHRRTISATAATGASGKHFGPSEL